MTKQTAERVLERLGLDRAPALDLDGLSRLYRAWCRGVPFDNVRKRIALATAGPEPLPGGTAEDFFAGWLAHGTGGTCWPTSNGLYCLLASCGFKARRISASMQDLGVPNHGSVIVDLDGRDFLVDSSMLTEIVLELRSGEGFEISDPVHPVLVEPVEGSWKVWFGFTMTTDKMPCRLFEDPVEHDFYLQRYEISREMSPFNSALYARRNRDGALVSFLGQSRFLKDAAGCAGEDLEADRLAEALVSDLGLSEEIVDALRRSVGL